MNNIPHDKKIVFFDGVCNLCSSAVQYIIERDKKDVFRFAALQNKLGQEFLKEHGLKAEDFDSIILLTPGKKYEDKSRAAFGITREFGGLWPLFSFLRVFPKWLTDPFYSFVARNRYKWYGKKESCWIPTPALKAKFLDQPN